MVQIVEPSGLVFENIDQNTDSIQNIKP